MNSKKVYFGMLALLGVFALLVVACVFLGDRMLRKQSDKLIGLKLENQVIDAQLTSLVKSKKDLETYSSLGTIAKQIVPQDKDQARAVREIVTFAQQSGLAIESITFPASTLGQGSSAAAAPATGSTSTTPPAAAKPATNSTKTSQLKAVDGIPGLYQLDIIVTPAAHVPLPYTGMIDFLSRLEQNRRTAQVGNITITPDIRIRNALTFSLTVTVYIKP